MAGIQVLGIMPRTMPPLTVSPSDRAQIQQWLVAHGTPQHVVLRGRIVLAVASRIVRLPGG